MIRLRITFLRDRKISHHRDTKHASYALAKSYWQDNVDYHAIDYGMIGAFWRGRKCLSLKVC